VLWECLSCSTVYAESLDRCPHCGSAKRRVPGTETVEEPAPLADDEAGEESA